MALFPLEAGKKCLSTTDRIVFLLKLVLGRDQILVTMKISSSLGRESVKKESRIERPGQATSFKSNINRLDWKYVATLMFEVESWSDKIESLSVDAS